MKIIRFILYFILLAGILGLLYVLFNTFTLRSKQLVSEPAAEIEIASDALEHFSSALRIRTVSPEDSKDFDSIQFDRFNAYLSDTYPLTDSLMEHKVFNEYSHLFLWEGSDPTLQPIILMGHLDVVPVIEANRSSWREEPFGGVVANDTIWGRGSIDDKIGVIGIMEAVEQLLREGFRPRRSVYLAFGHDEEIGGVNGAKEIATYLKGNGVKAEFIMDEGGSITSGMVPGIEKDVALIGIAEKGSVSLELSIALEGGHSSMPGKETAIDVLSGAIYKLKSNPFPARLSAPLEGFLAYLGPEMPFLNKMAFANKDLFGPLIIDQYEASASGNALVRTTTAPTIFNSGVKDNIIPLSARATLNFRIITGSSVQDVISHIKEVIEDDRIKIKEGNFNTEPSRVSGTDSYGFSTIHKTISQIYGEVIVSPYLVVGATDARHFSDLSEHIYRFLPTRITASNVKSFHGLNERIAITEFENAIGFYTQLIKNSGTE